MALLVNFPAGAAKLPPQIRLLTRLINAAGVSSDIHKLLEAPKTTATRVYADLHHTMREMTTVEKARWGQSPKSAGCIVAETRTDLTDDELRLRAVVFAFLKVVDRIKALPRPISGEKVNTTEIREELEAQATEIESILK